MNCPQADSTNRAAHAFRSVSLFALLLSLLAFGFTNRTANPASSDSSSNVSFDAATELPRADDPSGERTGVPDYALETLSGKELRLSSLRGKVVMLDFFSATCPHCQKHAPVIAALAKKYRARNFVVVSLCAHNPYLDRELVETYVRNAGIDNDVVWAPLELFQKYMQDGQSGVPQMVIFDTNGRVAARFLGWDEKNPPQVEEAVLKLIK